MIQIIEGVSGSGKSHKVYKDIIQASLKQPDHQFFLLVPEQFTMQAQRDIVMLHPCHGTMNIDILSFNRLAYRVFEELHVPCEHILEDFGKSMLLQRILLKNQNRFQVFGSCLHKPGFIDELKSLLTECFQYRIGRDDMIKEYERLSEKDMLKSKLHDLILVYDAFQENIQGHYIIAEHILEMLAKYIPASDLLRDCVIYLDGFTGFTPIQYEVLEALGQSCASLNLTVTIDRQTAEQETCEEHALFYLSKDTIGRIRQFAERLDLYVEECFLEGNAPRFSEAEELQHLEKNLFRYPYSVWKDIPKRIHIQAMRNPRQELRKVARQIHAMVREGRYRYQDIAVIHGNLETIAPLAEEVFPKMGIPYFIDTNQSIYMNPCLESIRAALDIVEKDFSYESVFRFLKTDITGIRMDLLEQLENDVLRTGIRGYRRWQQVFAEESVQTENPRTHTEHEEKRQKRDPQVLRCGKQVLGYLGPFAEAIHRANKVRDYVHALREFMNTLDIQKKLERTADSFESQGNLVLALSYRQIYDKLLDIMDKMEEILGEEELKREDFQAILETGLDEIRLGVIPPSLDQVVIGDIERTRLNHVKVLFVVGVNDGIIPQIVKGGGIFSEADRRVLSQNLELAPDSRMRVFTEQFYLYQNLTKASQELYMTYHVQDAEGSETLPAYLIDRLCKLFSALRIEDMTSDRLDWSALETVKDSTDCLSYGLRQRRELLQDEADLWKGLYQFYQEHDPQIVTQIRDGLSYNNLGHTLSKEAAARLYGSILYSSVSRLETYSRCPYQFFAEYGLKLKKREKNEVTLGDMGTLLHHVMEDVFSKVETRKAEECFLSDEGENVWEDITDETLIRLVEQAIQESVMQDDGAYRYSYANQQLLKRMQRTAEYAIVDLKNQLLQGKMIPYEFEMTFNRTDSKEECRDLESAEFLLDDGTKMQVSGVIDRMDICQDEAHVYVKVMDYKSSSKELDAAQVSAGLQLQLLVYTGIAIEILKKRFPHKTIVPVGSFYYGFRIPMVEKTGKNITDALERNIRRATAMTGIVNQDVLDSPILGNREILPVKEKKTDGEGAQFGETVLDGRQYQAVLREVRQTVETIGTEMLQGNIPVRPVKIGNRIPCDYCDYRDVCKLDCRDGGNQIYTVSQLQAEGGRNRGVDTGSEESD